MKPADLLLAIAFILIWGSAFNAARLVVLEWPPFWALALRFLLTAPLLLAIAWATRSRWPARGDAGRVVLMGLLGTGGYLAFSWWAMSIIPSGLVALITAATPLVVALGETLFLGRRPSAMAWAGLALGWAGVAVLGGARLAGHVGMAEGMTEALGVCLALLGAVSQAAGLLIFAPARGRVDLWSASAGQSLVSAALLLALALVLEGAPPTSGSGQVWLGLLYSVTVVGIGGYALLFIMLRRFPPSTAAALQLLAPPVAAVIGWAALGEVLGWADLAGGVLTLGGLMLLFRARAREARTGR
ncbi:Threonine/homoserine efflux transporter RhtA [Roseomonas rosea]|uniref:Threonine/homoserine efflux transporter RhtA n=1 Tax=Muricoccus roseus TaxID=198092 RepID=A0A1M6GH33_9PROT|nr:DMT family transporter [Roseomonas rosea]SHJ09193.1 Threonine/homoserine efflux transporter RhtA [Roseomonas rosea]